MKSFEAPRMSAHSTSPPHLSVAHKTNAVCHQFVGYNISIYLNGASICAVFGKDSRDRGPGSIRSEYFLS